MNLIPDEVVKGNDQLNPSRLILVGHHGVGKTALAAQLSNSLLIDYEDRSGHVTCKKVNVPQLCSLHGKSRVQVVQKITADLKAKNAEQGDFVFDFLIHDTLSSMERVIDDLANINFTKSVVGKGMAKKGNTVSSVIAELPDGSGYRWLFEAYQEIMSWFDGTVRYGHLFLAHAKQGSMIRKGQKLDAADIDFTGKMRLDIIRNAQACGTLYRDKDDINKLMVSFAHSGNDLVTKASSSHLHNKEFVISEYIDEKVVAYWDKIYPGWV